MVLTTEKSVNKEQNESGIGVLWAFSESDFKELSP